LRVFTVAGGVSIRAVEDGILRVFDARGALVASRRIDRSASLVIPAAAGVYQVVLSREGESALVRRCVVGMP
jgi:hypothetical protein